MVNPTQEQEEEERPIPQPADINLDDLTMLVGRWVINNEANVKVIRRQTKQVEELEKENGELKEKVKTLEGAENGS